MKFRVGLIGLGTVSNVHLKALAMLEEVSVAAICDSKKSKEKDVPEGIHFYENYEDMLEKEHLDAVHVCLPHYLHYDAMKACAKKGVNVLCEKPIALNRHQLKQMEQLQCDYDFTLGVCLQNRLNPTFLKLRELVGSGAYGKVLGIKAVAVWARTESYYEASPWRGSMEQAGGGCMINQAIHTLDQMQLIGGKVLSVKGQICNLLPYPIEVEDTACAQIVFENNVKGTFLGTLAYVKNSSIELQVVCESGNFTIKDYALWYAQAGQENEKKLVIRDRRMPGAQSYYGASHVELIHNYYETLEKHQNPFVTLEQGGQVILLIEAIRKSSLENREVFWKEIEENE